MLLAMFMDLMELKRRMLLIWMRGLKMRGVVGTAQERKEDEAGACLRVCVRVCVHVCVCVCVCV